MYVINDNNLQAYILKEYGDTSHLTAKKNYIQGIKPSLQEDYGEDLDCTLTSITTVVSYYKPQLQIQFIYDQVEKIAKKFLYKGNRGTPTITMNVIFNKVVQLFQINLKSHNGYIKNLGYNYVGIKNLINKNRPTLLSLSKDGRNFYANHTVLVIGYYEIGNAKMIAIYDNWYKQISYIDYNKLAIISGINYLT